MATKKRTTRKSSSPKAKTTKKPKIEKIEKKKRNQSSKPKEDKRKNNGGAREGAGRKPLEERERNTALKDQAEIHALDEVDISITTAQGVKVIKQTRSLALLDVLFTEGVKRKNITAIKEYFDRTRGKSRQPIEHSGEIKTEDQYIPDDPATLKAHEVYVSERRKLIDNGYYDDDGE